MDSEKRENIEWSLFLLGLVAAVFFQYYLDVYRLLSCVL